MRPKVATKLDNIVEIDEVYIGGKVSNMSKHKRTKLRKAGLTFDIKTMVMGMIERGGDLKLITIGKSKNAVALRSKINENVDKDAVIITDSLGTYTGLNHEFAGHEVVNHSEHEYVRDSSIHTNSIEGAFSMLKRSIIGIYHQVTPKHLSRYCDETMFRYNLRKMKDTERFTLSLQNTEGRLRYKTLVGENIVTIPLPETKPADKRKWERRSVQQIKDGQVLAEYPTIKEAAIANGFHPANLRRVLTGQKKSMGGYLWKYV